MPDESSLSVKLMAINKAITDLNAKVVDLQNQINIIKLQATVKAHFGDWSAEGAYVGGAQYKAVTDGFVVVWAYVKKGNYMEIKGYTGEITGIPRTAIGVDTRTATGDATWGGRHMGWVYYACPKRRFLDRRATRR